jgi:hypothetical protein
VDGNFEMDPSSRGARAAATLAVDFDAAACGRVNLTGVATLADTLEVNTTGYRPKEGQKYVVIRSTDPNAVYFSGNFATITTNITLGSQGLPFFAGNKNGGDYEVTFQGLTAGDANGSHSVDGGDLALMGGSWTQSGRTWANGDFTGDGGVDGGDLALIGGTWNWSAPLPSPVPPGQAVPEPASAVLLMVWGLALLKREGRS